MTDRFAQGGGEHAGWSIDLRLESVTQNRLRSGTRSIDASEVSGEEAIERHTRNFSAVVNLGYGFDESWSLSLRMPLVRRDHLHDQIDEQSGLLGAAQRWRFTKAGDMQVLLRRHFAVGDDSSLSWAVYGGLKLPTGSIRARNADGTRAERALQPGSGTVDAAAGVAARNALGGVDALMYQASAAQALNERKGFKPGHRVELSGGWSHAYSHQFGALVQLNYRHKGRDSGVQAEPNNSGGTTLDLSPGVTFGPEPASTLYAYVQVPLYQKTNGIQLVPRRALAVGWTTDF